MTRRIFTLLAALTLIALPLIGAADRSGQTATPDAATGAADL
ncbi:hypothetical protein SAMN05444413_102125 [Roseivivax marinus]|jgi:hypothetical protein|nr:hypothetical protein [Roseivivax marinus]SEK53194.1 hypothetical protein SAMN05444413_102125 [Roseivivax marinus]